MLSAASRSSNISCKAANFVFSQIKVRMQMKPDIQMRTIVVKTFKNENFFGFFKGMGPPFCTVPLINSIIFASYEFSKRMMNVKSESDFTFNQALAAGCFAGLVNSAVVGPIELVKCRL
jgi:hypothetical protein